MNRGAGSRKFSLLLPAMFTVFFLCSGFMHGLKPAKSGTVSGQIVIDGVGPMMEGTVFFINAELGIPPSATRYWLVPTHAIKIDENSKFSTVLPEGTYYVGAIERKIGDFLGPPEDGDYFFISQDNSGEPRKLTVWKNSTTDLGILNDTKKFSSASLVTKGGTSIQGTIRDEQGKPVEGMAVYAYTRPDMLGKPLFVSGKTGKDGKYTLRLYKGGTYYLMTRVGYGGGPPGAGELLGAYKDGKPLSVKTSTVRKGTDIEVYSLY